MFLLSKVVDQSVLREGFSVPLDYQQKLFEKCGFKLERGQKKPIKIDIDGKIFDAVLTNILFDAEKYPSHGDLLQVRYPANGELSKQLQSVFSHTYSKIQSQKIEGLSARVSSWDNSEKEYISVYATPIQDQLYFECITNGELIEESFELKKLDEIVAEQIFETEDLSATVKTVTKNCKVRKMNRAIGDGLKQLYGYRCQICGAFIGEKYGSSLIHAHHIEYFTKSMNNDASNVLIVCPNHHGIIHDRNPVFDFQKKIYRYPNGYQEGLKLNLHI